ncbi:protein of unknown function [Ruminococcaceae bacterium BL-6]|nr:protein of unknown function [Ruminococcaceae bacterium BL-6]
MIPYSIVSTERVRFHDATSNFVSWFYYAPYYITIE